MWLARGYVQSRSVQEVVQESCQAPIILTGVSCGFPEEEAVIVTRMSHGLSLLFSEGICERGMGYQHQ